MKCLRENPRLSMSTPHNDQNISVNWLVDGDSQKTEENVTSSSYELKEIVQAIIPSRQ